MDKKHNTSDYMGGKERENGTARSFPEELVEISKSVYTHIFGPIGHKRECLEKGTIDFEIAKDMVEKLGNAYNEIMHPYEKGGIDSKFNEFLIDFKNQLELICEKIKRYVDDEQYRDSKLAHKLIDGMFKLNDEFYNLYSELEQNEIAEKFSIRLRDAFINCPTNINYLADDNGVGYNNVFYYNGSGEEKEIEKKYREKIDQIKYLWVSIYRFLIQLVNKEMDNLLTNQNEESFRNGLERSYIGEHIKGVEYGDKFSRSYSILQDKQAKLSNKLSQLEECFDEAGNLKEEAKLPVLDDIRILEVTRDDRRKFNKEQVKANIEGKLAGCLNGIKKVARSFAKPFSGGRK